MPSFSIRLWYWLLLPLLLLVALLLSAGRLLLGSLGSYQTALQQQLNQQLPLKVEFQQLRGGWRYLSPLLEIKGLKLSREGVPLLQLAELELELDLPASLWHWTPIMQRVRLKQGELDLPALAGLAAARPARAAVSDHPSRQSADPHRWLPWVQRLWLQRSVQLSELRVRLPRAADGQAQGASTKHVLQLNLGWQQSKDGQRLHAELQLGADNRLELRGVGSGVPGAPQFRADYYLRGDLAGWPQLRPLLPATPYLPETLQASGQLWGALRGMEQHQLKGLLEVPALSLALTSAASTAPASSSAQASTDGSADDDLAAEAGMTVDGLALQLQWQQQGPDWQGMLSGISGVLNQQPLSVAAVQLAGRGSALQEVQIPELELAPLWQRFLATEQLPLALRERLRPLNPRGTLRHLQFQLGGEEASPSPSAPPVLFHLLADMDQVAVDAWQGAPEAAGISGRIELTDQAGRVDLNSNGLWLNFPELYRQGWQFERASGVVSWQRDEAEVRVESELLSLVAPTLNANGRFVVEIPTLAHPERQGRLILMIGMQDSDATQAPLFVPDRIVNPGLFHWLESALHQGRLRYGGLVYDAPLLVAQEQAAQRTTQLFFDTTATRVAYQTGWPAIHDADAFTLIRDSEVLVQIPRGRLYDNTRVEQAEVYLAPASSRLEVRARMDGPAADGRLALLESPIGAWLGEEFARWQLQGEQHTELNLGIDLSAATPPRVQVSSQLHNAEYWSEALNLRISAIEGRVQFDDRTGLFAESLQGRLFGRPVTARIQTDGQGNTATTTISGQGALAMGDLRQWSGLPLLEALDGRSDYAFKLRICGYKPGCSGLEISSDLVGVQVDAPEPLAKPAASARPLQLDLALIPSEQRLYLQTPGLEALLALRAGRLLGGEIGLGTLEQDLAARNEGIGIVGHLTEVDLQQWRGFIERYLLQHPLGDASTPGPAASAPTSAFSQEAPSPLRALELRADRLRYEELQLSEVALQLEHNAQGWHLGIDSTQLQGDARLPVAADQPLRIALQRLHLPEAGGNVSVAVAEASGASASPGAEPAPVDKLQALDPRRLRWAEVEVKDLRRGDKRLGDWAFELRPGPDGARVEALRGQVHGLALKGGMHWRFDGQQHRTDLLFTAAAEDLGDVMEGAGSARSMETEGFDASAILGWSGTPLGFTWAGLNGSLELQARRGRILDSGERPVLKLFSLLNMRTLLRRLSFDFADLTAEGLFFDRIDGLLGMHNGVAQTLRTATLLSPTHDIDLEGRVDLGRELLDMELLVKLPVSENLPIAAALLAAPPVAGAVFLVERLIGDSLKRFTSVRYRLNGPWNDPKMEPLRKPPVPADEAKPLPDTAH